jgi:uracil DNA glycosylase
MVWGKSAHLTCYQAILNSPHRQYPSTSSHPSPLGMNSSLRGQDYQTGSDVIYPPFVKTDHFKVANRALRKIGAAPIDWELEE